MQRAFGGSRPGSLKALGQLAELGHQEEASPGPRRQRRWIARGIMDAITEEEPS